MTIITEEMFNSLGYFKVKEVGTTFHYIQNQYYLTYDSSTGLCNIVYGRNTATHQQKFYGIVNDKADLEAQIAKNNINV